MPVKSWFWVAAGRKAADLACAWSMYLQSGVLVTWWGAKCSQLLTFQRPLDLSQSLYLPMNLCAKNCGRSGDSKWKMVEFWLLWVFRHTLYLCVSLYVYGVTLTPQILAQLKEITESLLQQTEVLNPFTCFVILYLSQITSFLAHSWTLPFFQKDSYTMNQNALSITNS